MPAGLVAGEGNTHMGILEQEQSLALAEPRSGPVPSIHFMCTISPDPQLDPFFTDEERGWQRLSNLVQVTAGKCLGPGLLLPEPTL